MLVVIFGPMYRALRQKLVVQEWLAAGLTTGFVLIIVLVPLALLVVRAGGDAIAMVEKPHRGSSRSDGALRLHSNNK